MPGPRRSSGLGDRCYSKGNTIAKRSILFFWCYFVLLSYWVISQFLSLLEPLCVVFIVLWLYLFLSFLIVFGYVFFWYLYGPRVPPSGIGDSALSGLEDSSQQWFARVVI